MRCPVSNAVLPQYFCDSEFVLLSSKKKHLRPLYERLPPPGAAEIQALLNGTYHRQLQQRPAAPPRFGLLLPHPAACVESVHGKPSRAVITAVSTREAEILRNLAEEALRVEDIDESNRTSCSSV